MGETIAIKSKQIADYVMFKLDKIDNDFTQDELNTISQIVININEGSSEDFYEIVDDIVHFNNIEEISIRNGYIYNESLLKLLDLKKLNIVLFEKCRFENADFIAKLDVKELSLFDNKINNYDFVYQMLNLKSLRIINGEVDLNKINELQNLEYLQLSYCKVISGNINIQKLIELDLDNTFVENLSFVRNLSNLQKLYLDQKQYESNKNIVSSLKLKGIAILDENMLELGGNE